MAPRDDSSGGFITASYEPIANVCECATTKHACLTSATRYVQTARTAGGRGTLQYKAPELFDEDARYAKPADVYGFSMLLFETFTGVVPWTGSTDAQITGAHVCASLGQPAKRPSLPSGVDWRALAARSFFRSSRLSWSWRW